MTRMSRLRIVSMGVAVAVLGLGLAPVAAQAANVVATVTTDGNTIPYSSLKTAVDAAPSGSLIDLQADTVLDRSIWFDRGRTLSLNLNEHTVVTDVTKQFIAEDVNLTITGPGKLDAGSVRANPVQLRGAAAAVENYTVVNLVGGIDATGYPAVMMSHGNDANNQLANNGMVANIDAAMIHGNFNGVSVNGSITAANTPVAPEVNISNSTIVGVGGLEFQSSGMYLAGNAVTTVTDSTILGSETAPGIEVRSGALTLSNTNVTGGMGVPAVGAIGSGGSSNNAALVITQLVTKQNINVVVDGGTYTGGAAVMIANPQANNPFDNVEVDVRSGFFNGEMISSNAGGAAVSNFIAGGSFLTDVLADGFVAADKVQLVLDEGDLRYVVTTEEDARMRAAAFVVNDGVTVFYESLADAQAATGDLTEIFQVSFDDGSGVASVVVPVNNGDVVAEPAAPVREGSTFEGWSDGTNIWNFDTPVTQALNLTAVWEVIPVAPVAPVDVKVGAGILQSYALWPAVADAESYVVTATQGAASVTCKTTALSCALNPLSAGDVSVTVVAVNEVGASPASEAVTATVLANLPPIEPPANSGGAMIGEAPASAVAGEEITISVGGFAPGSVVYLYLYSAPIVLGSAVLDANGVATFTVTVPSGIEAGAHTLVATGLNPAGEIAVATQSLEVQTTDSKDETPNKNGTIPNGTTPNGTTPTTTAKTGSTGQLSKTGFGSDQLMIAGIAGLVLVVAGGALVATRRKAAQTK